MYLDTNNLYGWGISQKLPANSFKWIKKLSEFNEDLIKNYNENNNKGCIFEVDVKYPKSLFNLHSDSPFLVERNKIAKCNKLVCNIHDKGNYVVHIKGLKQALSHGLILKKIYRVIQFNQKAWFKPFIGVNTELRTEAKNNFEIS